MKSTAATLMLVAVLLGSAGSVFAGEVIEPRQMLERMTTAMSQMSYQGTFVYFQGDNVETMRITHVSDERGVRERLVAVSGPPREVLRDSNGVRWVLADDRSVFEDTAFNRSFFPELPRGGFGQEEGVHETATISILHTTDLHGHVMPTSNYRGEGDLGGLAR